MLANPFEALSDNELEQSVLRLAAVERDVGADIVLHLVMVNERKLHLAAGYDSMFSYCSRKLGFSKSTAFRRQAIVVKAAKFPQIAERLRDGRLQMCAAATVAQYLTNENVDELLDAIAGLSHREVDAYVNKWFKARAAAAAPVVTPCSNVGTDFKLDAPVEKPFVQKTFVKALDDTNNRVSVTLSDKTLANLRRAKEVLGCSDDEIIGKALEQLLDKVAPERRHARRKGTKKAVKKTSRRGAIKDRDQVVVEHGAQCAFVAADGTRCTARHFLQIDHIKPWALGGPSTAENFRPLCRAHNAYLAAQTFSQGKSWYSAGAKRGRS
jgi:hypothetical protein